MAKKYNIKTVADAVNAVTKDNIDLFLTDFSECLRMGLLLKEGYKEQTGEYPPHATLDEMIWTDDGIPGLTSITMKLETQESEENKELTDEKIELMVYDFTQTISSFQRSVKINAYKRGLKDARKEILKCKDTKLIDSIKNEIQGVIDSFADTKLSNRQSDAINDLKDRINGKDC